MGEERRKREAEAAAAAAERASAQGAEPPVSRVGVAGGGAAPPAGEVPVHPIEPGRPPLDGQARLEGDGQAQHG